MNHLKIIFLSTTIALTVLMAGCERGPRPGSAPSGPPPADYPPPPGDGSMAQARILGQDGSDLGTATFTQVGWEVKVEIQVQGVEPGPHGIAVHEFPQCVEDFRAAGLHLNPDGAAHGCPGMPMMHPGDLGNIEVGDDGTGSVELTTHLLTVLKGSNTVVGMPFILRERRDDCYSRPNGNAGNYIGCGVIEMIKDTTKEPAEATSEGDAVDPGTADGATDASSADSTEEGGAGEDAGGTTPDGEGSG